MQDHESRIQDLIRRIAPRRRPKTLYHYTSGPGLLGILTTQSFWATNIRYLNDTKEFGLAIELSEDVIATRMKNVASNFDKGLLETIRESLAYISGEDVYVTSFTKHPDQLGQWRGYCNPGDGYSVGVLSKTLMKQPTALQDRFLVPCVYDRQEHRRLVRSVLDQVSEHADDINVQTRNRDRSYREAFKLFDKLLPLLAPAIKHPSFKEEDEWRLVALARSFEGAPEFRSNHSMLVPFYRQSIDDGAQRAAICEIVIGPSPYVELAKRSVATLVAANAGNKVAVTVSDIPYRNW